MISESVIRNKVGGTTFQKGMGISLRGKVKNLEVDAEEFEKSDGSTISVDFISADVNGSTADKVYHVTMAVNPEKEEINQSDCECPAFISGDYPICKHCVATLLKYNQETMKSNMMAEFAMMRGTVSKGKERREAWKKPVNEDGTNKEFLELMKHKNAQKLLPLVNKTVSGQVQLEPHLILDAFRYEVAGVEFKIGITQMYVLKDIFEFCDLIQEGKDHSYGQKLHFIHTMDAFDEQSQKLIRYMIRWVNQNKNYYRETVYTSYYSASYRYEYPKLRYMKLTGKDLEDLLLLCDGQINLNFENVMEKRWNICHDPYKIKLNIEGVNKGAVKGLRLEMEDVYSVKGDQYYMTFAGRTIYMGELSQMAPVLDFVACMEKFKHTMYINSQDVALFEATLLPDLQKTMACSIANFEATVPENAIFKIYLDAPQKNMVSAKLVAVYGDREYQVFDDNYQKLITGGADRKMAIMEKDHFRDYGAELKVAAKVSAYFNAYDQQASAMVLADDDDSLYELLTSGIEEIGHFGEVYVSDAIKNIKIVPSTKVQMGVSVSGNVLKMSLLAGEMNNSQLAEILSRYDRKKKYYRLKCGDFVEMAQEQYEQYETLIELKAGMHLTDAQMAKEFIEIPRYRSMYLDDKLSEDESIDVERDEKYTKLITNMSTATEAHFHVPSSLKKILRPYQENGYQWIRTLKANGFGGILADDMGLGKTLQVITLLQAEREESCESSRTLITSPASLVFNWNSELERFAPDLNVCMVIGTAEQRKSIIENAPEDAILLTSYDLLKRDLEVYEGMHFANAIIDEAQYIKNHNTQAARAVKEIQADFKLALTGTPVENSLSELWSIFDYIMPGFLFAYQRFRKELELPIVAEQDETSLNRLQKMIAPFILRRLKKNVLQELPDKTEENVFARIEGEQKDLYEAHVQRMKIMLDKTSDSELRQSKIQILAELTRLRQLCCDPALVMEGYKAESAKLDLCMEMIQNAINGGHKILLFSQFTTMLERIEKHLKKNGIAYYSLTGATPKEKRAEMVDAFQKDEVPVFCISLKAGGTGLNLTAADIVIHYDPWWNVAAQNQATDRAHRIGQDNPVTVYRLIAKGTIEENIMKLQDKKQELADQVINGDGVGSTSLNRDELLELLGAV